MNQAITLIICLILIVSPQTPSKYQNQLHWRGKGLVLEPLRRRAIDQNRFKSPFFPREISALPNITEISRANLPNENHLSGFGKPIFSQNLMIFSFSQNNQQKLHFVPWGSQKARLTAFLILFNFQFEKMRSCVFNLLNSLRNLKFFVSFDN